MREKLRRFMIGRYGTDGLNQFLSIASLVLLLIAIVSRISLFTWLGVVLLGFCYYRTSAATSRSGPKRITSSTPSKTGWATSSGA